MFAVRLISTIFADEIQTCSIMFALKRLFFTLFALAFPLIVCAQSPVSWEDFIEQILTEDGEDSEQDKDVYEQLEEIHAHPMNLNVATVEDLLQLPFLSEEQARDIVFYRVMHGPLRSTGELMFIETLSKQDRDYLQLFCYAGESAPSQASHKTKGKLLKNIKNEAVLRTDIPFYYKAGQQDYPEEVLARYPNRSYRGDPLHVAFRYALSSMNHLFAGVQMEKDAGERGIDYVSGYLMLKDIPTGRRSSIREAIIGNYRTNFGLGLVINTSVNFGKSMMINRLGRIDQGFSKHSSTMETGYLTGAAIRYHYGSFTLSAFGGYNKIDGTFTKDSAGISSLKTDGLHRTPLEYSKRHNLSVINVGGNVHWETKNQNLQLSAMAVATHYSTPLTPQWNTPFSLYRKHNAQGTNFQAYSLAYAWRGNKLRFTGETALSHAEGLPSGYGKQTGFATLNSLQYRLNSQNTLTTAIRYYGAKFVSINGKAFGENAQPQNEEGIYLAWNTTMIPGVSLDTYVDLMYFPWLKYSVSQQSYGFDYMVQATFTPNRKSSWFIRYRMNSKQKNAQDEVEQKVNPIDQEERETILHYNMRHTLKLQHSLSVGKEWTFSTNLNGCLIDFGPNTLEKGFSVGECVRWTKANGKVKLDLSFTYFHTDGYNARIYAYEPSLLYSFGFTSYFYHGIRAITLLNWNIYKGLTLTTKFGLTKYFNRDNIGTGTELIAANHREDLQLMLRWKF